MTSKPYIYCTHDIYYRIFVTFCKNLVENNFQELHVYKGFPSIKNTHNHCVGTHNHCVPYWKTTFRAPCLPGPLSLLLLTTQTTTVWAEETTVWVNSSVKTYWKTTFKGPMFIRGSPYNTTHITTVWAHTTTVWADETTVWVNSSIKTQWKTTFKDPMFIRGFPP